MASNQDDTSTTPSYELACVRCSFETTVVGSVKEALDVAEEHEEARGGAVRTHFVNILKQ